MKEEKQIKVCSNHSEKQIPLIWTFAFPGAEYWCPYCGYTSGMFGAGENVPLTPELKIAAKEWGKRGKEFLSARSSLVCDMLKYKGKYIKPSELPKKEIEKRKKIVDEWKYADEEQSINQ